MLSFLWLNLLAIFIIIGSSFFFVIPGMIIGIWFSLANFVFLDENLRGMNALLKSREYVRGYFFKVFWYGLFLSILLSLISYIYNLINLIFMLFLNSKLISLIINVIFVSLLTPFVVTYIFLIYGYLKVLKNDLEFTPTFQQKALFISIGVIGYLFLLYFIYKYIVLSFKIQIL